MMVSRIWARSGVYLRFSDLRARRKIAQSGSISSLEDGVFAFGVLIGSSGMGDCMRGSCTIRADAREQ